MQVKIKAWHRSNRMTRYYVSEISGVEVGHVEFSYELDKSREWVVADCKLVGNEIILQAVIEEARRRRPQVSDDAALESISQNGEVYPARKGQKSLTLEIA